MFFEEPKVEFVRLDVSNSVVFTSGPKCMEDGTSGQGGGSCIGNQDHSHGEGCTDTAPLISS